MIFSCVNWVQIFKKNTNFNFQNLGKTTRFRNKTLHKLYIGIAKKFFELHDFWDYFYCRSERRILKG